jgi:hypothetical protein
MEREDILVNCIDEIRSGKRTLEECMARHPRLAKELEEIVCIIRSIESGAAAPTAEFKQRVRGRLLREIASTRSKRVPARTGRRLLIGWRLGYAIVAVILLLAIGSGGAAYASQDSLPGDVLYAVKTGVEKFRLVLAFSPDSRANLRVDLAELRIQEVADESVMGLNISTVALSAAAKQIDVAFQDITAMSPDAAADLLGRISESTTNQQAVLEKVSGMVGEDDRPAVEQAIQTTRRGNIIARIASGNRSLLNTGVSVYEDDLDEAYFEIEGDVLSVDGNTWNVGGIELNNVNTTDAPPVGHTIKVYGLIRNNKTYLGEIEDGQANLGVSSIRGVYTGENAEGQWSVSGLTVGESDNATPPPPGDEVEVKGKVRDGVFNIEGSWSHEGHEGEEAQVAAGSPETANTAGTSGVQTTPSEDNGEVDSSGQTENGDKATWDNQSEDSGAGWQSDQSAPDESSDYSQDSGMNNESSTDGQDGKSRTDESSGYSHDSGEDHDR